MVRQPRRPHLIQVYHSNLDLHVVDGELRGLSVDGSVHSDHARAVEVETRAIAPLHISVHVHAMIVR